MKYLTTQINNQIDKLTRTYNSSSEQTKVSLKLQIDKLKTYINQLNDILTNRNDSYNKYNNFNK